MNGLEVDLAAVLDRSFSGDCGVPGSAVLLRFADAGAGNSGPVSLDTVDGHDVEALFR